MKRIVLLIIIATTFTLANAQNAKLVTTAKQNQKTSIKIAELQKTITDNITNEFSNCKILEAYKLGDGAVVYQVVVEKDAKKVYLYYDKDGKFLSKTEMLKSKPTPVKSSKSVPVVPKATTK
ncbi:MAG: hypothetical protein HGB12_12290 [Bacteroidetes bacterium]|nr:hypothetical protein [Bacteroidota bacterium]